MNRRSLFMGVLASALAPAMARASSCERAGGRFFGEVQFRQDSRGYFKLIAPYAFVDGCGKEWSVPYDAITDGASIPRIAQLLIGDPYSGPYLNGAIVHDWYCVARTEPHDDVHRMFYNAMIASKVSVNLARIMYAAVCWRGPKWDELTMRNARLMMMQGIKLRPRNQPTRPTPVAPPDLKLLEKAKVAAAAKDISTAIAYRAKYKSQLENYENYQLEISDLRLPDRSSKQFWGLMPSTNARDRGQIENQFRGLVDAIENGNKPLDYIENVASNFTGSSKAKSSET